MTIMGNIHKTQTVETLKLFLYTTIVTTFVLYPHTTAIHGQVVLDG